MLDRAPMLDCLINYPENHVILVSGSELLHVPVPKVYRSQLYDTFSCNRAKGIYLTQTLFYSNRALYEASSRLHKLFGKDFEQINRIVGKLAADEKLEDLDERLVAQRANELAYNLQEKYGSAGHSRRVELMEQVFVEPVITEVCAMHWKAFVCDRNALLVDERYNTIEKTYEYLFQYKGRRFLVANCGTGKVVILPVGEVNTCQQAQEWLAGDTVSGMPLPKFISRGRT